MLFFVISICIFCYKTKNALFICFYFSSYLINEFNKYCKIFYVTVIINLKIIYFAIVNAVSLINKYILIQKLFEIIL